MEIQLNWKKIGWFFVIAYCLWYAVLAYRFITLGTYVNEFNLIALVSYVFVLISLPFVARQKKIAVFVLVFATAAPGISVLVTCVLIEHISLLLFGVAMFHLLFSAILGFCFRGQGKTQRRLAG